MISKKQRITELLGNYWDIEAEVVHKFEHQLNSTGLEIKIPFTQIELLKESLQWSKIFFLWKGDQNFRGHLNKPYLSLDETYQFTFCLNSKSPDLVYEWSFRLTYPYIRILPENVDFWASALKQNYFILKVKRLTVDPSLQVALNKEHLLADGSTYANNLKSNILRQLSYLKSKKLIDHRLELWQTSLPNQTSINQILSTLPSNDFGIKDVFDLHKVCLDFSLDISNSQLLSDLDPQLEHYKKKLGSLYQALTKNQPLE